MREDRPVGSIVRDPTLVELAKRQPAGRRELGQIRGLNPEVVRRRSADLLEAIERGRARRRSASRRPSACRRSPWTDRRSRSPEALVRARAQEAGLAYELIAARADLTPIVVAARRGDPEPAVRTLKGWRRELVGAELLELLRGRRRLGIGEGGRVEIA